MLLVFSTLGAFGTAGGADVCYKFRSWHLRVVPTFRLPRLDYRDFIAPEQRRRTWRAGHRLTTRTASPDYPFRALGKLWLTALRTFSV